MRYFAALVVALGLAGWAGPVSAADCETVVGWVGVPLCQDAADTGVQVPTVTGEATSAAADAILEGVGLDLGVAADRCYDRGTSPAVGEVIGQSPAAGTIVPLATLVNIEVATALECVLRGRPGIRIPGGFRIPGL